MILKKPLVESLIVTLRKLLTKDNIKTIFHIVFKVLELILLIINIINSLNLF